MGSSVQDQVADYIIEACGVANTTDFLNYFARANFEKEIEDMAKDKFKLTEEFEIETQRLYTSRARAAYRLAIEVSDRVKAEADKPKVQDTDHPDQERPLDPVTVEQLEKAWTELHKWKQIAPMRPAPPFRNRIYRDIKAQSCKLVPVEKVKTAEEHKTTTDPIQLTIGGAGEDGGHLIYEAPGRKSARKISSTLEYVSALRVVMGTYAFCGTHKVDSHADPAVKVTYFPWETALGVLRRSHHSRHLDLLGHGAREVGLGEAPRRAGQE